MRVCDYVAHDPHERKCLNPAQNICSECKQDFCDEHMNFPHFLCLKCLEVREIHTASPDPKSILLHCRHIDSYRMICMADAVTTCEKCNKELCGKHNYLTRLGRICAMCMERERVPILPPPTRVRVPDQPNGGTRTVEVRPLGVFRVARVVTMNKLLTAGGSYLLPGGAIVEIEGEADLDLTEGQFKSLFEEI